MSFTDLKDIKQKLDLPEIIIEKFNSWLKSRPYNQRKYMLPEHFSDDVKEVTYDTARKLMYVGVQVGFLKTNYEVHCPRCNELVEVYHRQMDIPDELINCESCNYKFNPWQHEEFIIVSFSTKG